MATVHHLKWTAPNNSLPQDSLCNQLSFILSSELWRCVDLYENTNVSEKSHSNLKMEIVCFSETLVST
jgi:hypothetical protein